MRIFQLIVFSFFVFCLSTYFAQQNNPFQYVSPKPNSTNNTLESTIILRQGSELNTETLEKNIIQIKGTKSGDIIGDVHLSSDEKTIIIKPTKPYMPNEVIYVKIINKISNTLIYNFSFETSSFTSTPNPYKYIDELKPNYKSSYTTTTSPKVKNNSNFPNINVEVYDSTKLGDGYIFLSVSSDVEGIGYYLMMLNNDGTPYYSKELENDYAYDFKLQQNGQLTYAQFFEHHSYTGGGNVTHMIMDNNFEIVDSVQMGNGYVAEAHDFQILPNGHFLLFGYYLTQVDMSLYVEGGQPNAMVSGGVIQELDADKNVIFQWRTWDYYDFASYDWGRRSSGQYVSAFHLNTINLDTDNNVIFATPLWVKKLNRQTGEIIWNLGDNDNDFSFEGCDSLDGLDLVGGHMFHQINNNNFLLYDNGNRQGTRSSKVNEFSLDEENKIARLVWTYEPDTLIAGWHRGNAQRLPNGNTVIGWGGSNGKYIPAFTEVDKEGNKLLEFFFDDYNIESYRAFRFPFLAGKPQLKSTVFEVSNGNSYTFDDNETGTYLGLDILVNQRDGEGYNELTMKKFNYAPLSPQFIGKAPSVIPVRFVFSNVGLSGIDADIKIDVDTWGIKDPQNCLVYHREFENAGLFVPLLTTYNPVTKKLIVNTNNFGEFIFATSDLEDVVFTPKPFSPEDGESVNQELSIMLEWNPIGFATTYSIQIAKDSTFNEILFEQSNFRTANFLIEELTPSSTYYWRVNTTNEAGTSEWSKTQNFKTVAPSIVLTEPSADEQLQRGLPTFIKWNDNIIEDVRLDLYSTSTFIKALDITASNGAYQWDIDPNLEIGNNYQIKISSTTDSLLFDISNEFSVIDTVTNINDQKNIIPDEFKLLQNYPNPFNPTTIISYNLAKTSFVTLKVYDLLGKEVASLVNGEQAAGRYNINFDASSLVSGIYIYKISTREFTDAKKMILLR